MRRTPHGPRSSGIERASTKKETVNGALWDYVARFKRLEAAEKLAARGERGEFEAAAAAHAAAKRARRAAFE